MRPVLNALLSLLAALLLGGCVYSSQPVGDVPIDISAEQDSWTGTWSGEKDDSRFTVRVVDAAKGILRIDWVEEREGVKKANTAEVFLRSGGGWTFASVSMPEPGRAGSYLWMRLVRRGDTVLASLPKTDAFRKLVEEGRLGGKPDGRYDVLVDPPTSAQLRMLTAPENAGLFENAGSPLRRLAR